MSSNFQREKDQAKLLMTSGETGNAKVKLYLGKSQARQANN